MKKFLCLLILAAITIASPLMAFDEHKFTSLLQRFDEVAIPVSAGMAKGGDAMSGPKGQSGAEYDDFVWLKAEELNKQLEFMIQGIETAKQISVALAIIVNLYQGDKISVEAALTAVQILKLRAVFIKVFVSNGNSELEIMINILQEHEDELSKQAHTKTQVSGQVQGKINNAVGR